ncbi:hypothetical protein P9112_001870 [Eukaryota sp. TZLM1-RC]
MPIPPHQLDLLTNDELLESIVKLKNYITQLESVQQDVDNVDTNLAEFESLYNSFGASPKLAALLDTFPDLPRLPPPPSLGTSEKPFLSLPSVLVKNDEK